MKYSLLFAAQREALPARAGLSGQSQHQGVKDLFQDDFI
jgi:hypothetical protein